MACGENKPAEKVVDCLRKEFGDITEGVTSKDILKKLDFKGVDLPCNCKGFNELPLSFVEGFPFMVFGGPKAISRCMKKLSTTIAFKKYFTCSNGGPFTIYPIGENTETRVKINCTMIFENGRVLSLSEDVKMEVSLSMKKYFEKITTQIFEKEEVTK